MTVGGKRVIHTELFKEMIVENEDYIGSIRRILPRDVDIPTPETLRRLKKVALLYGVRRSGKSFTLLQLFKMYPEKSIYVDFEDERLQGIQTDDLEKLWEAFLEIKGENAARRGVLLFDEIQNVPSWEKFVRRLVEKKGVAVYCAGSSSRITPREIHTSLRGRVWSVEILPFSFREYVKAKLGIEDPGNMLYGDRKVSIKKLFREYLNHGGMPEVVFAENDFERRKILKEYLQSMYFRDMVEKYGITNIPLLDALWDSLFSSYASKFSPNGFQRRYRGLIRFSKDTLYAYYKHFLESMLVFEVRKYTESPYKRMRNPAKIYLVDHGLARKVSSENLGRILENVVYIHLRRLGYDVHYLEEEGGECDFIAVREESRLAVQVTWNLSEKNREREIRGLLIASEHVKADRFLILTYDQEEILKAPGIEIEMLPVWKWALTAR